MKKFLICALIFNLLIVATIVSYANTSVAEIKVYLNGEKIILDVAPIIVNGRTMVPLSTILKALDMDVSWEASTKKVTVCKDNLEIVLYIGSDTSTVNGVTTIIDAPAFIVDGRTMVPLRFVAESTGITVEWDSTTRSVMMTNHDRLTYKIVDTGVSKYYTDSTIVTSLSEGASYYGQDANYDGFQSDYTDNHDGTVTDKVTGLMWQQTMDEKMTYDEALVYAENSTLGGYTDWRLPTIKELFSLILFTGESGGEAAKTLYIDTDYFDQPIGDTSLGEREIDAQVWSSNKYVSYTMNGDETVFGVNFIDGRIKGYGLIHPKTKEENTAYFRLVRGNTSYGENLLVDNKDGTISDLATGLMWQLADDGQTRNWEEALEYAENLELAGYEDWRLPNIKELQSIVDYGRSPATTNSPAINAMFVLTPIIDPNGHENYGFYWSSTTHQDGRNISDSASYVAFGEAQGMMNGKVMDVHGAGAVRSDPKSGFSNDYPEYFGPQGDIRYVYNFVISVRDINE